MRKEDFDNPIDYIIYKVNGDLPKNTSSDVPGLRFYDNKKTRDRVSVFLGSEYVCACSKGDAENFEEDFYQKFDGKNLGVVKKELKRKYKAIPVRHGRNNNHISSLKDAKVTFTKKGNRYSVRTHYDDKTYHLCNCSEEDMGKIKQEFNSLKRTHTLDEIKKVFKKEYNLHKRNRIPHRFQISSDGLIYKDEQFLTNNPRIYELLEKLLR